MKKGNWVKISLLSVFPLITITVLILSLTYCNRNENDITISVSSFSVDGAQNIEKTQNLHFTLSEEVNGLIANNIILEASHNVSISKGELTHSGNIYTLPIQGVWNEGDNVKISSISLKGFLFNINSLTPQALHNAPIQILAYLSNTDGLNNSVSTKNLHFILNQEVNGLTENDIALEASGGAMILKGELTHSGNVYALPIGGSWNEGDTITISSISLKGYLFNLNSLTSSTLHRNNLLTQVYASDIKTEYSNSETKIKFSLSQEVSDLTANNIELSNPSSLIKGILSNTGSSYTLSIGGNWQKNDLLRIISITKANYDINVAGLHSISLLSFQTPTCIYGKNDDSLTFNYLSNFSINDNSIRFYFPGISYDKFSCDQDYYEVFHEIGGIAVTTKEKSENSKFVMKENGGISVAVVSVYQSPSTWNLGSGGGSSKDFMFIYDNVPTKFISVPFYLRPGNYNSPGPV